MIRVVIFLAVIAGIALAAAWIADRPGDVTVTWLGYRVETSVMVTVVALCALAAASIFAWSLLRGLMRTPRHVVGFFRERRATRGYRAISRGLVAIGSGDMLAARRFASEARRLTADEPLALLLSAQTAQLAGDRAGAERTFQAMVARDDTKLLGLHGLFVEARRRNDPLTARLIAEEAVKVSPSLAWAAEAVLDFRCADGDWVAALAALDSNVKAGLIDKATAKRQRAVLLTARAMSGENRDDAKAHLLEAVKLCPDLIPAAAAAGRMLAESGDVRRASRVVEAAWRANPHPDLAETYAHVRLGDSARDRLSRVQALARMSGEHAEGALAVARAAIDAREFTAAREALAPLIAEPTQRVALLMAELEEADTGDVGRTRQWMARAVHAARDPAWTADGLVSDTWMPVSPATGRLDAFQWKVPLSDLSPPGRLIEPAMPPAPPAPPAVPDLPVRHEVAEIEPEPVVPPRPAPPPTAKEPKEPPRLVKTVIPLVHVPDDPGTEQGPEAEPTPEPARPAWKRLFS